MVQTLFKGKRGQRGVVIGQYSDLKKVEAGVPELSIIGLFIFSIFINDIV